MMLDGYEVLEQHLCHPKRLLRTTSIKRFMLFDCGFSNLLIFRDMNIDVLATFHAQWQPKKAWTTYMIPYEFIVRIIL